MTKHVLILVLSLLGSGLFVTLAGQEAVAPAITFSICESSFEADSGWQRVRICMAASDSSTFHSRGQVYLKVEGANLANIPADQIVTRHLDLLNQNVEGLPAPRYQTLNVAQNGNTLVATWQAKNLGIEANAKLHTRVPSKATGLYEFLIPAKAPLVLSLNPNMMRGQTFFITEGDKAEKPYAEGEW